MLMTNKLVTYTSCLIAIAVFPTSWGSTEAVFSDSYATNRSVSALNGDSIQSFIPYISQATLLHPQVVSKALDRASQTTPVLNFRGSSGVNLYRRAAAGVVLVCTNESMGSGAVLENGQVLTNHHVIEGYERVGILFKPAKGKELSIDAMFQADVVKIDELADLALLKLTKQPANITSLELGKMDTVEIAMEVHAMGHPEGQSWTYTTFRI